MALVAVTSAGYVPYYPASHGASSYSNLYNGVPYAGGVVPGVVPGAYGGYGLNAYSPALYGGEYEDGEHYVRGSNIISSIIFICISILNC